MAENTQRIQVLQYIPDREGGVLSSDIHKRPLPGVTIEISGAPAVHCDRIGCATVHFQHLVTGDHVNIKSIAKPGFRLFSLQDMDYWYVPENSHEDKQILMISNEDLAWIEEQWQSVFSNNRESRFGYSTAEEYLICKDMSVATPLQKRVMAAFLSGESDRIIEIYAEEDLLEKFRSSIDGDPKKLQEIEDELEFMLLINSRRDGSSPENIFSLVNSIFSLKADTHWLMSYYPDLCHELRRYEEYEAYVKQVEKAPHLAAADRAYLQFWNGYNQLNSNDIGKAISVQEKAVALFDSISSAIDEPDIYPYDRGFLENALGSNYWNLHDYEKMDYYFSRARHFFDVAIKAGTAQEYSVLPYYAIQAETYWRSQYNTKIVDGLIRKVSDFVNTKIEPTETYLSAYLSTLRRLASIYYLQENYEEAYRLISLADEKEKDFFKKRPQLRADHFARFLLLQAQICTKLGKMEEADEALTRTYDAYDVLDRLHPGNYKKDYLTIHLLHAPVRIATGQHHWAASDLNRSEVLAQDVYAGDQHLVDSIYWVVEELRKELKPKMISEEAAKLRYNPDRLEFCFITDTHNYGRSADIRDADQNISSFVEYCNEHPAIQCAVHGGDLINAYDTNHESALWCLTHARYQFAGLQVPFYSIKGNHDCNGKQWKNDRPDNSQIVTDKEYFDLFHPFSVLNPLASADVVYNEKEPTHNYYYKDYDVQRVRMIFLNAYCKDSMEVFGYTGEQMRWLAENALDFSKKEVPEDWSFIIFGHTLPSHLDNGLVRFLRAYNEGAREFHETSGNVPFQWSAEKQKRALMIALVCGHQHIDIYNNLNGYNHINVTRGFATGNEVEAAPLAFSHFVIDTRNHTLLENRIGNYHSRVFSYGEKSEQLSPHPPFKSADGMGSFTTGAGEKGRIITVTNLANDGEGSLRWAISQSGARYITFKTGGTIQLTSPLVIDNDSITILGQTAPKPVILLGDQLKIKASEVIIRYLTIEPGAKNCNAIEDDHFGQKNLIIDHVTVGHTLHSGIALRYVEDATVQRCRIEGTLSESHPTLLSGGFKVTYYNNLINGGNRAIKIAESIGTNRWIHLVRNVICDWKDYSIYGGSNQAEVSITDNYLIPTERTQQKKVLHVGEDGTSRYYVRKNTIKGLEDAPQRSLIVDHAGVPWRMPLNQDKNRWNQMDPVARPNIHQYGFSSSCITIAAFHYKEIDGSPTPEEIYSYVSTNAGNIVQKRLKRYKDKNGDGLPDQFHTLQEWLNAIDCEQ